MIRVCLFLLELVMFTWLYLVRQCYVPSSPISGQLTY